MTMIVKRSLSIFGLAGLLALLGTGSPPALAAAPAAQSTVEIKIDNFSFVPPLLKVAVGATVTWVNRDDIPHTAVSTEKVFKSKVLDTDDKYSYTFIKAGTYPYFCSLHPKMTGQVVVQ
jgi:plastocyanin